MNAQRKFAILILALLNFLFITNVSAQAGEPTPSPYKASTIIKSSEFTDILTWVSNTYSADNSASIYYLPETVKEIFIPEGQDKDKYAISFETYNLDGYYLNTLVDSGKNLNLYTIKDPSFQHAKGVTGKSTPRASCDTCNCVLWVRCARAPWLPSGLTYIWDKKNKMNSSSPSAGRVAVHDIYPPYGHVSYITKVSGSTIYIDEANYVSCKATSRSGTASSMKIVGYIKK